MRILLFLLLPCTVFAYWIEADYLAWFIKKNPEPVPLVTFANEDDDLPGALGQPHTRILMGKESIGMGWLQGFEISLGGPIYCKLGVEAAYLFLPSVTKKREVTTSGEPGSPNLAVPIYDTTGVLGLGGVPGETIFVLPGPLEGSPFFSGLFDLRITSFIQGAEINGVYAFADHSQFSIDLLAGLRWFELKETLRFKSVTITVPGTPFSSNASKFNDRFQTFNNYLAAQIGVQGQYNWRWLSIEGIVKGSVGTTIEELKIQGSSSTITGTVWFTTASSFSDSINGGIFAEPSNIGSHRNFPFAWSIESRVKSIFKITENFGIDIGYTFLWISRVLRPGKQIDRKINSTRTAMADLSRETTGTGPGPIPFGTPGPAPRAQGPDSPNAHLQESFFWAQGFNVGIQFSF